MGRHGGRPLQLRFPLLGGGLHATSNSLTVI